ncbi:MAG: hypothetical protein M3513_00760 [Actinomycetota bacterium]|nr:hypothetical protein [Actinomycetota bacterium]
MTRAFTVAIGLLMFLVAVEVAVLECFLLPSYLGPVPIPLSIPAAVAGNLALPTLALRLTGSRVVGVLPVLGWLTVAVVASVPRPEGDLIVTGSLRGLAFLLLGAVAGAYAVARIVVIGPGSGSGSGGG